MQRGIKSLLLLLALTTLSGCSMKKPEPTEEVEPTLPAVIEDKSVTFENDIVLTVDNDCNISDALTLTTAKVYTNLETGEGYKVQIALHGNNDLLAVYENEYGTTREEANDWQVVSKTNGSVAYKKLEDGYCCLLDSDTLSKEDLLEHVPTLE